jgi:hypothetical protein
VKRINYKKLRDENTEAQLKLSIDGFLSGWLQRHEAAGAIRDQATLDNASGGMSDGIANAAIDVLGAVRKRVLWPELHD